VSNQLILTQRISYFSYQVFELSFTPFKRFTLQFYLAISIPEGFSKDAQESAVAIEKLQAAEIERQQ
jgi:hypothetical protein